jgi:AcrR family transcriptional regulator
VYLEKGIHMEVRDVAVKAELGYGTVYHYYKNKHMLLEDLLWNALSLAESAVLPAIEGNGTAMGRSELYSRLLFLKCIEDPSVFILLKTIADNFHQMPGNRFQKLMAVFQERLYLPLVEMIKQEPVEQPPEKLANLIYGSIVGCATLHIHHNGESGMDSLDVIDLLFFCIRKKES